MSILSRFGDIVDSNINALLDKMEDPSKMVDKYLKDARENLAKVKEETAGIMAAEKARKRERDEAAKNVDKYMDLATKAVKAGNDGDAKVFLAKKQEAQEELAKADQVYQVAHQQAQQIIKMHDKLVGDIQELERRKNHVKATAAVAATQETLNQVAGVSAKGADVSEAFGRMEQKAQERLDRATAAAELSAEPVDEAAQLEAKYGAGSQSSVDEELAALKASLAGDSSKAGE